MIKKMIICIGIGACISLSACEKNNCRENCDTNCICTADYTPVCGCNGKTYSNSCNAECCGITEYTSGECQ